MCLPTVGDLKCGRGGLLRAFGGRQRAGHALTWNTIALQYLPWVLHTAALCLLAHSVSIVPGAPSNS